MTQHKHSLSLLSYCQLFSTMRSNWPLLMRVMQACRRWNLMWFAGGPTRRGFFGMGGSPLPLFTS